MARIAAVILIGTCLLPLIGCAGPGMYGSQASYPAMGAQPGVVGGYPASPIQYQQPGPIATSPGCNCNSY